MRRFQQIVIAAYLMMFLVMNTNSAGTWCRSYASVLSQKWKDTTADRWSRADLSCIVSIYYTRGHTFLHWAETECVV
jgi:hypothetical protein